MGVISSRNDLRTYLRADLDRNPGGHLDSLVRLPQARFLVQLRITEWWCNTRPGPVGRVIGAVLRLRLQLAGTRLGYTIPINVVGPGLKLPHIGTVVISGDARVGANCQIFQGVTLAAGDGGAPQLGHDVSVGANACIIGPRQIGDRVWIGAGAVVTRDVPSGQVWAGVPARFQRALD